jgi:uncharacterized membrane protein YkoI
MSSRDRWAESRHSPAMMVVAVAGLVNVALAPAPLPAPLEGYHGPGWAQQQQNRARLAVREGRHVPLLVVIKKLRRRIGGQELDARLEQRNGRTVYRLRWTTKGRRTDYLADAQTGHVIGVASVH